MVRLCSLSATADGTAAWLSATADGTARLGLGFPPATARGADTVEPSAPPAPWSAPGRLAVCWPPGGLPSTTAGGPACGPLSATADGITDH